MNLNPTQNRIASRARRSAFTLIELLVVIAIIAMLAAMIANLAAPSSIARKRKLMDAAKEQLITAIENYKAKIGFYPPDNVTNIDNVGGDVASMARYAQSTAMNSLFYELTGVTYSPSAEWVFYVFDGNSITTNQLASAVGRQGIANSAPTNSVDQRSVSFLIPAPNATQYKEYSGFPGVYGLVVPVSLDRDPANPAVQTSPDFVNFWHYDASSANRHNMDSYDVWAVYSLGKNIVTNGNWIQQ